MSNANTAAIRPPVVASATLSAFSERIRGLAAALAKTFAGWPRGAGDTLRCRYLNDHVLRDIGISRAELGRGPAESFWRD